MIYLDSSAVVKLAHEESETSALRTWLTGNPQPLASSALTRTETARALLRSEPAAIPVLHAVLALLYYRPITDEVLDSAAKLPGATLRSLDAIHLATAAELRETLSCFVTYDKRLAEAAELQNFRVIAPG